MLYALCKRVVVKKEGHDVQVKDVFHKRFDGDADRLRLNCDV